MTSASRLGTRWPRRRTARTAYRATTIVPPTTTPDHTSVHPLTSRSPSGVSKTSGTSSPTLHPTATAARQTSPTPGDPASVVTGGSGAREPRYVELALAQAVDLESQVVVLLG